MIDFLTDKSNIEKSNNLIIIIIIYSKVCALLKGAQGRRGFYCCAW